MDNKSDQARIKAPDSGNDSSTSPIGSTDAPSNANPVDDGSGNNNHATSNNETSNRPSSSSSPIEIRQAASGKFGVLHARPSQLVGEPVPIEKIIKTANTMSSMMMAHKIAIEDDFKLEPGMDISGPMMSLSPIIGSSPSRCSFANGQKSDGPSLHNRVKDIVHEAYWDLFKLELDSQTSESDEERKYDLTKQLLRDIKQKILELLLPQHARLKQDIEDRLDPKIIDQLTKAHSLNLVEYGHYILSVLSKLCAPVRDEKLKSLSETNDVVQLYKGIMELLELMRLDFANFTLNQYKPHIKAHSQDYEREKFNEILKQQKSIGIDGLEYTKVWLERATKRVDEIYGIAELVNDATTNVELDESTSGSTKDQLRDRILRSDVVDKVLNAAYCELLEWTPQTQKLYPETLLFDEATFRQLKEQYKVLLLTSSILLTVFAFVNRLKLPDDNNFKVLIKSHAITLLTASYDKDDPSDALKLETVATKLCDDIRQRIQETNKDHLELFESQHKELLKRQILDIQSPANRVRDLARRRILEFVETLINLDIKHHQKKFPSKMPPPVNIPLGLNCLSDEITLTMAQLVKIIRYNRRVFFQHYQDIIVDQVSKLI
jgi:hypothetical protein